MSLDASPSERPLLWWERQLAALPAVGVYREGRKVVCRPPFKDDTIRTRGLRETSCRLDYETGELRCGHPHRAPGNLDCRHWYCPDVQEMRERVVDRQRRALAAKMNGGQ